MSDGIIFPFLIYSFNILSVYLHPKSKLNTTTIMIRQIAEGIFVALLLCWATDAAAQDKKEENPTAVPMQSVTPQRPTTIAADQLLVTGFMPT